MKQVTIRLDEDDLEKLEQIRQTFDVPGEITSTYILREALAYLYHDRVIAARNNIPKKEE